MRYRFLTCDVFTATRFGGNPLAVVPEAQGLDPAQMQAIAREFNLSETTFVLPPEDPAAHAARVRIFTPRAELPFAGHPTVGTALALAWLGRVPAAGRIVLEEGAGPVPVELAEGRAEFRAPGRPARGAGADPAAVAGRLGLEMADLVTAGGLPCDASAGGVPFLFVELAGPEALGRARLRDDGAGLSPGGDQGVFLFTRRTGDPELSVRARMYAPRHGIPEDPATGSAAAALAGLLGGEPGLSDGWHGWRIGQGIEMGRPSLIEARALRRGGEVAEIRIAGTAVPVMDGEIEV